MHNFHQGEVEQETYQKNKPIWKIREQRKQFRKKIFGEHYNYNYRKPVQNKKYRIDENRNTEIQRENRILLEKIQTIFQRSSSRKARKSSLTSDMVQPISHQRLQKVTRLNTEQAMNKLKRESQQQITTLKKYFQYNKRVILFKGKKRFRKRSYKFIIYIEDDKYIIEAESSEAQQMLQMPYSDYQKLLKTHLNEDSQRIFQFLKVNSQGLLEFQGFDEKIMELVQYGEVSCKPKNAQHQVNQVKRDYSVCLTKKKALTEAHVGKDSSQSERKVVAERKKTENISSSHRVEFHPQNKTTESKHDKVRVSIPFE